MKAIRDAVAEEREACAQEADKMAVDRQVDCGPGRIACEWTAKAIRARK